MSPERERLLAAGEEVQGDSARFPWQGLFIIGSARSGSTWLQALLAAHPLVASSVELGVFNRYVAHWAEAWAFEMEVLAPRGIPQGLRFILSADELRGFLKGFVGECYRRVAARKPGATHVLDKHPGYSKYVQLIDKLMPGARFVHLIRDGRDVVVSTRRAGPDMAFGTLNVAQAGRLWARTVNEARTARCLAGRYLEVKYEDLLAEPTTTLASVFGFCGLQAPAELVADILGRHGFAAMRARLATADPAVPAHPLHYQEGRVGRWQQEFSLADRYDFDRVAGDLLCELGYARPGWWKQRWWEALAVPAAGVGRRVARTLPQLAIGLRRGLAGQRVRAYGTAEVAAGGVRGVEQGQKARAPQP